MMTAPRKLSSRASELLLESDEIRIKHIKKEIFILYPRAIEILAEMEDLLVHPKVNRMPNLLIVGRSDNGKTEILQEFRKRHPAEDRRDMDVVFAPVIYVQSPPGATEHLFLNSILTMLGVQSRQNETMDRKLVQLIEILRRVQNRILMVDEVNALLAGSVTKQRFFLSMLKYLSNELQISIVAAGTADAQQAVRSDAQILSRFPSRILPRWQQGDDFRKLLYSFEYALPLKIPSELHKGELISVLYGLSEGVIGRLSKIIRSGAEHAIQTKVEKITLDVIYSCQFVARGIHSDDEVI